MHEMVWLPLSSYQYKAHFSHLVVLKKNHQFNDFYVCRSYPVGIKQRTPKEWGE